VLQKEGAQDEVAKAPRTGGVSPAGVVSPPHLTRGHGGVMSSLPAGSSGKPRPKNEFGAFLSQNPSGKRKIKSVY